MPIRSRRFTEADAERLDRDITEQGASYTLVVSEADDTLRLIRKWFYAATGVDADEVAQQHAIWRASVERAQFGNTLRGALYASWPIEGQAPDDNGEPVPEPPPTDDPYTEADHELLDRDLNAAGVDYQTLVTEAPHSRAVIDTWFANTHDGFDEAPNPERQNVRWRASLERAQFGNTLRRVLNVTWPWEAQAPTAPPMFRLLPRRNYFVRDDGKGTHHTVIGITSFVLQKFSCEGRISEREAWLQQVQDMGFNTVRDFSAQEWGDPAYDVLPTTHPDYYTHLAETAQACADHGLYYMACLFGGWQPSEQQQLDHFNRSCEALRPYPNVLVELVNENNASGFLNTDLFSQPAGHVSSHGSNGSQSVAVRPWWSWEAFHTNGAPEEQRKIGHNAMELTDGTPDWPASGVPTITNETSRYPEVGMWVGRSHDERKMLAYDSAAGAALLCAGSVYHSVNAKLCLRLPPDEEEIARAWVAGARSVPLEFQDGQYTASHLEGIELEPDECRRYARKFPDGRAHWVSIHW